MLKKAKVVYSKYMWFLFLTFLAEKDLLILLEMAKYFEMLSKLRNIEPNHIILLNIHQFWAMLYDVLNMWPMIWIPYAEYWKMLLDSYIVCCLIVLDWYLVSVTCYVFTCYLLLVILCLLSEACHFL